MNTKIWVVEANSAFSFGSGSPVGFFLSKEEAEFWAWNKNKEDRDSIRSRFYTIKECVALPTISDPKKYKEFLKVKVVQAEKEYKEICEKEVKVETERKEASQQVDYYQNLLDTVK